MISMFDWRCSIGFEKIKQYTNKTYDIAFAAPTVLDDRSDAIAAFISGYSDNYFHVSYSHSDVVLTIGENSYPIRDLNKLQFKGSKFLIDATTLAIPEIVHLFFLFSSKKLSFDVIYAQPNEYNKKDSDVVLENVESFVLSDDGIGPQPLPPFVGYSTNAHYFVCLGFEGNRLGSLVHSEEFDTRCLTSLIGVPAFQIGWENKALASNYKILMEASAQSPETAAKIAGANDPVTTYKLINETYCSALYQKRTLHLAPFGTKPNGIGVAWFAVNHSDVVLIYDFVKKRQKRSSGTDLIHLWRFKSQ